MPRITPLPWREFERFLFLVGCQFTREKGDHRIYWRSDLRRPIVVPRYNPLPVFIIRNNIRLLGMNQEEYLEKLSQI